MDQRLVMTAAGSAAGVNPARADIGTILLHVQNDHSFEQRLQLALSLTRATGAHLHCVQVTPIEAYVTTGTLGGVLALGKAIEKIDAEDAAFRERIETHLRAEDVSWDYQHVTGYQTNEVVRQAAFADIVVVGRDAHCARVQRPQIAILGDILTQCRTPLLIPGNDIDFDPFGPALVAWNGSYEAANATRAAVGLLKMASSVRIVRYTEEKPAVFADIQLTEYLSRRDIHAELVVRSVTEDFADDLVEHALGFDASYIVMGGYSHGRAGEFLFGGVTRDLLGSSPIALVMGH